MEKRKSRLRWAALPIIFFAVLVFSFEAYSTKNPLDKNFKQRADRVVIDTLKMYRSLERPAVVFLHDLHTEALAKEKQSCNTCHFAEKSGADRLSLKFKRLADVSRKSVMDIYHGECIGCHKEKAAAGKKAGPLESCSSCHRKQTHTISAWQPIAFDKSLHFRHTEAVKNPWTNKGDCAVCHHEYDPAAKKLFHAKDREGSCRYCHKNTTQENRISMRMASHMDCIDCHRRKIDAKTNAGPVMCMGCHDSNALNKIKKIENVPRMERKQPDMVLIRLSLADGKKMDAGRMSPVPFNHKAHEAANRTCRECHHESLQSCSRCHPPTGVKEGNFVNLERAMHQKGSNLSCIGCHDANQGIPQCAACHAAVIPSRTPATTACVDCHVPQDASRLTAALASEKQQLAENLYQSRKRREITYSDEEIPEKVTIGQLSDQYAPAVLPHRKIVRTLLANIRNGSLANTFHREKGTVCQGCHHNSPVSLKPPSCASCHGQPFNQNNPLRPGLKGAYHQHCMNCHQILKLAKPAAANCTDCHAEKPGNKIAG